MNATGQDMGARAEPANVVSTVADLRFADPAAMQSPAVPQAVQTLGALTLGDGGGGLWYWDGSDSTTPDNTGTVVADAANTGRWKRLFDGPLNVRWFGAKEGAGSGGDIGAVLQTIVDEVVAKTSHKAIYIPTGIWELRTSVVLNTGMGLEIYGEGFQGALEHGDVAKQGSCILLRADLRAEPVMKLNLPLRTPKIHDLVFIDSEWGFATNPGRTGANFRNYTTSAAIEYDGPYQGLLYNLRMFGLQGSALRIGRCVQTTIRNINAMHCGSNENATIHFFLTQPIANNYVQSLVMEDLSLEMEYGRYVIEQAATTQRVLSAVFISNLRMESVGDRTRNDAINDGWIKFTSAEKLFLTHVTTGTTQSSNPNGLPLYHFDNCTNLTLEDFNALTGQTANTDNAHCVVIENSNRVKINHMSVESGSSVPGMHNLPFALVLRNNKYVQAQGVYCNREGILIDGDEAHVSDVIVRATNSNEAAIRVQGNRNTLSHVRVARYAGGKPYSKPYIDVVGRANVLSCCIVAKANTMQDGSPCVVQIDGDSNTIESCDFSNPEARCTSVRIIGGERWLITSCRAGALLPAPFVHIDPKAKTGQNSYPAGTISQCLLDRVGSAVPRQPPILYAATERPDLAPDMLVPLVIIGNTRDGPESLPPFVQIPACTNDASAIPVPIMYAANASRNGLEVPVGVASSGWVIRLD